MYFLNSQSEGPRLLVPTRSAMPRRRAVGSREPMSRRGRVGSDGLTRALLDAASTHEHPRFLTLLIALHQLILCSGAFLPPVAFDCLRLPPACCVEDHGHRDVKEAEAELCCRHDVPFPIAALGVLSAQR
jgi:hypothetical protein